MKLGINVDHVATVREARQGRYPDPVAAAVLAELGGADGITVHLREDARHIKERDVRVMRETVTTSLNLEMSLNDDIVKIALSVVPDQVTIVPEKREELTTEGGLDVRRNSKKLAGAIDKLQKKGIRVNLFVEAIRDALEEAKKVKADGVELHTGRYADAPTDNDRRKMYHEIYQSAVMAKNMRLYVAAGHGLHYRNTGEIAKIHEIEELNIGHSVISRAVLVGMERAVREMKDIVSGRK